MKKCMLLSIFVMFLIISSTSIISCDSSPQNIEQLIMPDISASEGNTFDNVNTISITSVVNASIYYTLDGTEPNTTSLLYIASFDIDSSTTVKAIAIKTGYKNSMVQSKEYKLFAIKSISTGAKYSFVLKQNGDLIGFGDNEYKQLGTGGVGHLYNPTLVQTDINITAVASSASVSAIIDSDNNLYMIGNNNYGQFGVDTGNNPVVSSRLFVKSDVAKVSLGYSYSAIITTDGKLYTSGANGSGELGQGNETNLTTFTLVPISLSLNVKDVFLSASQGHSTFFITDDNKLYATGWNNHGQLGLGNFIDRNTPQLVSTLDSVQSVSSSFTHTLFLTTDNKLYGVGSNSNKQIDNTGDDNFVLPKLIAENIISMEAGPACTFYVTENHDLYAFGDNDWGRLGLGDTGGIVSTPTFVMANVKDVSSRFYHTLILMMDGTIYAVGYNTKGCLGDGTQIDTKVPIRVLETIL